MGRPKNYTLTLTAVEQEFTPPVDAEHLVLREKSASGGSPFRRAM